ncbi:MAG: hypothetical protein GY917_16885 [Planctomycetaceae bacterium]|nr:hypothetical protein [Planctomycetaceae bacterium]
MIRVAFKESRFGLRNSTVRIPFRYANTCLTRCPQAIMEIVVEIDGKRQVGFSGDCLPPGWFDKSPDKSFETQIEDMLAVIDEATTEFTRSMQEPVTLFEGWKPVYDHVHEWAETRGLPPLLAAFGISFGERALMDAIARHASMGFDAAVRAGLYGIVPAEIHEILEGCRVADWLPERPAQSIFARHTIGLSDPLTAADIPPEERLDDGFPQALEEYVRDNGICYLKVKVANDPGTDLDRIRAIAGIVERYRGSDYGVTLDGNEQYKEPGELEAFIEAIRSHSDLAAFWNNILVVEQPLDRKIALDPGKTEAVRELGKVKPVVIDESDGRLDSYSSAMDCGYRGVSSKNCKGPIKSLLNAGLVWKGNQEKGPGHYVMTGEDLCAVGVIPVQSDLCLVATLGLEHVERNGHHFHPGLSYLATKQQQAALETHPDLYTRCEGRVAPAVQDGKLEIGSLQCDGFGFSVLPDWKDYTPANEWEFSSLGLAW